MAKVNEELKFDIHNRFDIEVIDAKTGETKQTAYAKNVICNGIWAKICTTSDYTSQSVYGDAIAYGTGTGTPASSDTTLFHYLNKKDASGSTYTSPSRDVLCRRFSITIGVSESNNQNITEVGLSSVYDTSSNPTIFTHAMLQDMNGNPISIHKTDTDIINIYASIYLHISGSSGIYCNNKYKVGNILKHILGETAGNSATYSWGYSYVASGFVGVTIAETDAGYFQNNRFSMDVSANSTNKTLKFTHRLNVSDYGNDMKGIKSISICNEFILEKAWSPFTIQSESVGVGDGSTKKFKTKAGFPYNATVYVNGVALASGVTVKKLPSTTLAASQLWYTSHLVNIDDASTDNNLIPIAKCHHESYSYNQMYSFRDNGVASIYYNPMYDGGEGVNISKESDNLWWSDDLEHWTSIGSSMSEAEKRHKYYKIQGSGTVNFPAETQDGYNIIFDTAPANGDVITIDYTTDYIPKDSDHVLDIELTLTFGEYQGA